MPDDSGAFSASSIYGSLQKHAKEDPWLKSICGLAQQKLSGHAHGDLPRWRRALQSLPYGITPRESERERAEPWACRPQPCRPCGKH